MPDAHVGHTGPNTSPAAGDTILLNKFDYRDGARDIKIRILHVTDALRTVENLRWVRVLGIETVGNADVGVQRLFVIHVSAFSQESTGSAVEA